MELDRKLDPALAKRLQGAVDHADRATLARVKAFAGAISGQLPQSSLAESLPAATPRLARFGTKPSPLPPQLQLDKPIAIPDRACQFFVLHPPYMGGFPNPAKVISNPVAGVVQYEQGDRTPGRYGLLSMTYEGDPTASVDGATYRTATAHLFAWGLLAPVDGVMRVHAQFQVSGSSIVLARSEGGAIGYAYAQAQFQLSAALGYATRSVEALGMCRVEGEGPNFTYTPGAKSHGELVPASLEVPVRAGDRILLTATATDLVGVSKGSNLLVALNLSPLRSWFNGPGMVELPFVWVEFC